MDRESRLQDRLSQIKQPEASLLPERREERGEAPLPRKEYAFTIVCTEKALDLLENFLRRLKIKYVKQEKL